MTFRGREKEGQKNPSGLLYHEIGVKEQADGGRGEEIPPFGEGPRPPPDDPAPCALESGPEIKGASHFCFARHSYNL